ncbi:MAG: 50S ribosomal protein L18 [Alphaproteobacteria bacterium]|nr:50S ribosomal protein L18 [Alphaproteobacteria bacterium]NDC55826.1 50S ribosomal protein L18 [Alphaproteobacteria bacterium]NDG03744.1 50S ribosomal protein L18 [Alphaproteobacteria bacterium]
MTANVKLRATADRRKTRLRAKLRRVSDRMRLSVYRSGQNIYAQIIDDTKGITLVAASTMEKDVRSKLKTGANKDAAANVGKTLAERAKAAGISEVVFDRGQFRFHGRIKALADGAREAGLKF